MKSNNRSYSTAYPKMRKKNYCKKLNKSKKNLKKLKDNKNLKRNT